MRGYKVFEPDWTCSGFQYEVGKTFEEDVEPVCCKRGFHFCQNLIDCFNYYIFDPRNKVAEVEAVGEIDTNGEKSCTNKIKIICELSWGEVLNIVNDGYGNTGFGNIGRCNSGNFNSGNDNTGIQNYGNNNTGYYNDGHFNTGCYNSGSNNVGDYNIGSYNDGCHNIGFNNSGYSNNGNKNCGNCNTGDFNSGDYNIGNYNNGDWNKTNFSNGCFNTESTKIIMFNKPSNWTFEDWYNSDARSLLKNIINDNTQWVKSNFMTDEEKKLYPKYKTIGGYLENIYEYRDNNQDWWDGLPQYKKDIIKDIPNFDTEIFKEITGIDVKS